MFLSNSKVWIKKLSLSVDEPDENSDIYPRPELNFNEKKTAKKLNKQPTADHHSNSNNAASQDENTSLLLATSSSSSLNSSDAIDNHTNTHRNAINIGIFRDSISKLPIYILYL